MIKVYREYVPTENELAGILGCGMADIHYIDHFISDDGEEVWRATNVEGFCRERWMKQGRTKEIWSGSAEECAKHFRFCYFPDPRDPDPISTVSAYKPSGPAWRP